MIDRKWDDDDVVRFFSLVGHIFVAVCVGLMIMAHYQGCEHGRELRASSRAAAGLEGSHVLPFE